MWKPPTSKLTIAHESAFLFSTLSAQGGIVVKELLTLYMNIGYEYPKPPSTDTQYFTYPIWMFVICCVARLLE